MFALGVWGCQGLAFGLQGCRASLFRFLGFLGFSVLAWASGLQGFRVFVFRPCRFVGLYSFLSVWYCASAFSPFRGFEGCMVFLLL